MERDDPPPRWLLVIAAAAALAALGTGGRMLRSLQFLPGPRWIEPYRPAAATATASPPLLPLGPARTRAVTLFVSDGMRADVAQQLPAWRALGAGGVSVDCEALVPTFTRVGFATMLTGVGPRRHGFLSNFNRASSPVPSVFDLARRAGVHTRLLSPVPTFLPRQFPRAFAELAAPEPERLGQGPLPRLTLVYHPEPDRSWHESGVWSEAGRRAARSADRALEALRGALDLERETLIATSDHGHVDRGGHGGHEAVVRRVPLVLAGAGIRGGGRALALEADLRDVAATIAVLLGLPVRPGMTGRPLYEALADPPPRSSWVERESEAVAEPPLAAISRAVSTALAFAFFFFLLLRPRGLRPLLAALATFAAFAALYGASGWPWSFSVANDETEVGPILATLTAMGIAAGGLGWLVSGDAARFGSWAVCLQAAVAGALAGYAGLGAPLALEHLAAAYLACLALTLLFGTSLLLVAALSWRLAAGRQHGRNPEEG